MSKGKTRALPPGEGERRAQRGYVHQYDFAARAIYKAIAAGTLQWVGLADRSAGNFDDLVLGLRERIVAHQVKTRSNPARFNIRTLLLGRNGLLTSLVYVWKTLTKKEKLPVDVLYVCDDVPADDDDITKLATGLSSAAFLRALETHRSTRSLEEWRRSPYGPLISELENASELEPTDFAQFLTSLQFLHSGLGRGVGSWGEVPLARRRITDISALLPRLVADEKDKDRWSVEELLQRLNWTDPFSPRRGHTFPTDALVQSNRNTLDKLQRALDANNSGYVSLVGPPGCGKSTLLQIGLLPSPQAVVIRYLAFMPNEGHHLGRAEALDFLHDIVAHLKRSGLGHGLVTGTTPDELRLQVGQLLLDANRRFQQDGLRTIIVVDGLDHIPREERPQRSLLNELPLPVSVPTGVLFVLGTQKLDLEGMPPDVRDQAYLPDRFVPVEPLSREAVFRLVELSGLNEPDEAQIIFQQSLGHPLSVRYLIEGARNAISIEERKNWLRDGPAYGGDVENFYRRAWHDLEGKEDAREALALLALVEGKIRVSSLEQLVDSRSVDAAWDRAKHLLVRTPDDEWRIFHNSFRLFLREVTSRRHDKPAPALRRERYKKLARMSRSATVDDEQRWMELRYLARAEDHPAVISLCEPARFRQQFIEGRAPQAIFDDIRLSFISVASTKSARRLVELILARHEIEMRTTAMGVDRLIDAYIAVNDLDRAIGVIDAASGRLSVGKAYDVAEALLVEGRTEDARRLFEDREPISKLLGAEPVDGFSDHSDLSEWAERAALFRSPTEILTSISRLRPNPARRDDFDIGSLCSRLRFIAARWALERDSSLEYRPIADQFQVSADARPTLAFIAARSADADADEDLAMRRLIELKEQTDELSPPVRLGAAAICLQRSWLDLAATFFDASAQPELTEDSARENHFNSDCREVFLHATVASALGVASGPASLADTDLVKSLQSRLERLGWYNGRPLGQRRIAADDAESEIKIFLTFLGKARSPGKEYDWGRWRINQGLSAAAEAIAETAARYGGEALDRIADHIDQLLESKEENLGLPAFRRTFAFAAYRFQRDRDAALRRITWNGSVGGELSPDGYFDAVAQESIALTRLGEPERAKQLLVKIHDQSLGYALAPKKDPQYILWRGAFDRACRSDPAAIPQRVALIARLLTGMSDTEGRAAAQRIVNTVIKWAVVGGSSLANAIIDRVEQEGLASWSDILESVVRGATHDDRELSACVAVMFDRIGLPVASEPNQELLGTLVATAPEDQVDFIVTHSFNAAAIDGHLGFRATIMKNIAESAAGRGRYVEVDIAQWPNDPGYVSHHTTSEKLTDVRSLEELRERMADGNEYSDWDVNSAFRRVTRERSFDDVEPFLAACPILHSEEKTAAHVAMIALKCGRPDAAARLIEPFKAKASAEGSWGGWQSGAKTRVRRVEIGLHGDIARHENFQELCMDLSRGEEWSVSLLPDLPDVLDLALPRVTDAELWDILAEQLQLFREYRSGSDIQYTSPDLKDPSLLIGDLFMRALDLKIGILETQARIGLRELASLDTGIAITVKVIEGLWHAGGDSELQATRVTWECRDVQGIREAIIPQLEHWSRSRDLAVQRCATALARYWHVEIEPVEMELPSFYSIELPPDDRAGDFEQPLGFTASDEGLWTDDPYSWTWGLKFPLDLLSGCCAFDMDILRRRTAVLMAQMGGRAAFGPEIAKKLKRRYSRLDLRLSYHRPMAMAALLAVRQTAGEIALAGQLDCSRALYFLHHAGAFNFTTDTIVPDSRAPDVHRIAIPGFFADSRHEGEWVNEEDDDLDTVQDRVSGWLCLGSVSRFERRHFAQKRGAERLMLPSQAGQPCESLEEAWHRLPCVEVLGSLYPVYDGVAAGGVVRINEDVAYSFPRWGLTLCPRAAEIIGLKSRRTEPFVYRDRAGEVAARTVWWREGGFRVDGTDDAIRGHGAVLLAQPRFAKQIRRVTGKGLRVSAWRKSREHTSEHSSARHREYSIED